MSKRPTAATVIGWVFLVAGVYACVVNLMVMAMGALGIDARGPEVSAQFGWAAKIPEVMFEHISLFAGVVASVGLVGIVGGVGLLRGREWSRRVLESLTWLVLVISVAYAVVMYAGIMMSRAAEWSVLFSVIVSVSMAAGMMMPVIVLGAIIRGLRREDVRSFCGRQRAGG